MSEQTTNLRRADEITIGQHISDNQGVHEVLHVHRFDYGDAQMIALTARPLSTGVPWLARYAADDALLMATADEIRELEEQGRRKELADALCGLANRLTDERLPVGHLSGDLTVFLDDNDALARWAKALDVEVGETTTGGWPRVSKELPGLSVTVYGQQPTRAKG